MISRFFIERPVFATVLSILISVAGLLAMFGLPIAQYPNIVPPQVTVSANYPGASAEVIASTVAAPLEQQINGVPNMLYQNSVASGSGALRITVTFEVGTDIDQATIDVNNRVSAALAKLPEEVRRQGVNVQKRSASILQVVNLYSPDGSRDPVFLSNYALVNVIDEIKRIPGVGEANQFGAKDYSMRIWLRPDKLAQYGLTPADVAQAIGSQNSQFAAGSFGQQPMNSPQDFTYSVTTKGRFADPAEFENILLRTDENGSSLLLKDVARIELGAKDYAFEASLNGNPAAAFGIFLQPGANALETAQRVHEAMERMSKRFPEGVAYRIPHDTTKFVQSSINEVVKTFFEAMLLVIVVVFVFLQNWRATLIPVLAIPVSLVGTFAGMYLMGFSINLLTLFGMVLAIGIVVDDAIVVIENVERIMRTEKLSAKEASIKAMQEVTGPIITIVLVLCAVFIPVALMDGLAGQMYRQFAMTIAISVIISGIVALTLSPALCAMMLKNTHHEPAAPFRFFNRQFERLTHTYSAGVKFLIKRTLLGLMIFGAMIGVSVWLFTKVPSALVPEEDQGFIIASYVLPAAASLTRTKEVTEDMAQALKNHEAVANAVTFAGFDILSSGQKPNTGVSFITLTNWSERTTEELDARNFARNIETLGSEQTQRNAMVMAFNPPPISGMSTTGGFEAYIQDRAGLGTQALAEISQRFIDEAAKRPELDKVKTTFDASVPQYFIHLDRNKARALGVPVNEVFTAMQSTFGSFYVNDFTLFGRTYQVSMQAEADFRRNPDDLSKVFVRSSQGEMIPLSALVTVERVLGPDTFERFDIYPSAKVMGAPAQGYSSGQALQAAQEVAAEVLGDDFTLAWTGSAYQEVATQGSGNSAFLFGLLMVFLILAAQYERWALPFAVVAAVPFAVFGAIVAIWLRGIDNDVYFQVGLVTLIGLGAKNAILLVEFAVMRRDQGLSLYEAALDAARLRFRPIVMTSLAFILGVVPLAISTGAGSASRHSIGTGVIGGMIAATAIAMFFIPMFYLLVERIAERLKRKKIALDEANA